MFEAFGVVLENESFGQGAGDAAFVFGKFADRLELMLRVVGNGAFLVNAHESPIPTLSRVLPLVAQRVGRYVEINIHNFSMRHLLSAHRLRCWPKDG